MTSLHALIDVKFAFLDASGSYDVVLLGVTQLWWVGLEI